MSRGWGSSEQNLDSVHRDDESMMDDSTFAGSVVRGTGQESLVGAHYMSEHNDDDLSTRKRLSIDELVQHVHENENNVSFDDDVNRQDDEDFEPVESAQEKESNTFRQKIIQRVIIAACLGIFIIAVSVIVEVVTTRMVAHNREDSTGATTASPTEDECSPAVDESQLACVWPNLQDCGTEIIFNHILLNGSIPTSIELATSPNVTHLQLVGTELTGPIPSEIGLLTALTYLHLDFNQLTGRIPTELGLLSNLHFLSMAANNLEGSIPVEIGELSQLSKLNLSTNINMESSLPTEIGMLTELRELHSTTLSITGTIPTEMALLAHIVTLRFGENYLSGTIPTEMGLLSNLQILDLTFNDLSGTLPLEICALDVTPLVECHEIDCSCCECCTNCGEEGAL